MKESSEEVNDFYFRYEENQWLKEAFKFFWDNFHYNLSLSKSWNAFINLLSLIVLNK